MIRPMLRCTLLGACLLVCFGTARADRRYFVQSYTPYVAPAGNLELETWAIARAGQGDSTNAAWQTRAEFEYAVTHRLTAAAYFNFVQDAGGAPQRFDGPSLELIYQLAEPGKLPVDPAAYFEVRANGTEVELEPKLLLGRRMDTWVAAANAIGEIEYLLDAPPGYESTEKAMKVTLGLSRELGSTLAVGLEGFYTTEFEEGASNPSAYFLGPTINLQSTKLQLSVGWHAQIAGSPKTSKDLNLADQPRSEFRLILGLDL